MKKSLIALLIFSAPTMAIADELPKAVQKLLDSTQSQPVAGRDRGGYPCAMRLMMVSSGLGGNLALEYREISSGRLAVPADQLFMSIEDEVSRFGNTRAITKRTYWVPVNTMVNDSHFVQRNTPNEFVMTRRGTSALETTEHVRLTVDNAGRPLSFNVQVKGLFTRLKTILSCRF